MYGLSLNLFGSLRYYRTISLLSFYCIIFYTFAGKDKRLNMNKPKTRIKEILEKRYQADMVGGKARKELLYCQFLCMQ